MKSRGGDKRRGKMKHRKTDIDGGTKKKDASEAKATGRC